MYSGGVNLKGFQRFIPSATPINIRNKLSSITILALVAIPSFGRAVSASPPVSAPPVVQHLPTPVENMTSVIMDQQKEVVDRKLEADHIIAKAKADKIARIKAEKAQREHIIHAAAATAPSNPTPVYQVPAPVYSSASIPTLLNRIKMCESGGNYRAENPSGASGAYQFIDSTWAGFGGYARAMYAPPAVQDAKALATFNSSGTGPWVSSMGCWG